MRRKLPGIFTAVFALLVAVPAFAHHGFAVEFDGKACRDMTGTLTGVDWQNPHIYFHVDIKDANGKVAPWSFEAHSVPLIKRGGTTRQDFLDNVGKTIVVRACPAKSGTQNRAAAEILKLSDGRARIVGQDVEGATTGGLGAEN
jgi:hypothetical protein